MTNSNKIKTLMRAGGLDEAEARALLEECDWNLQRAADKLDEIENGELYPNERPRVVSHINPEEIGATIEKTVRGVIRAVKEELDKGSWKVK